MSELLELATYSELLQMQRSAAIGKAQAWMEGGVIYAAGQDFAGSIGVGRVVEVAGQPMVVTHLFSPPPGKYRPRRWVAWTGVVQPLQQAVAAPVESPALGIMIDMTAPPEAPPGPPQSFATSGLRVSPADRW